MSNLWYIHQPTPGLLPCGQRSVTVLSPFSLPSQTLLTWINDVLEGRRIIVRDIVEDIYDGQVLGELLGKFVR
jgi:hypothetical protein